ncbi:MAG: radical SAM protein [Clostridiales bacterium]|jgi:MoaA/NifB/PqqE/SkfB family radical SAM enzyme|nr:radical SAM protein [Clostridiales bacterium]
MNTWCGGVPDRVRVPSFIHMEVTDECRTGCPQCYAGVSAAGRHMDFDLCENIVRQAASFGIRRVLITGGEPLCYPRIVELIRLISAKGIVSVISTSGLGLDKSLCNALKDAGLSQACVSLNGSREEIHNLSRTGFNEAVDAIKMFSALGFRTIVNWVARADNVEDFPRLIYLCKKIGAHGIEALANKRHGGVLESALGRKESRFLADILTGADRDYLSVDLCYESIRRLARGLPTPPFGGMCGGGRVFFDVLVDGQKTPCRHLRYDSPDGDTKAMTLAEYWRVYAGPAAARRPCQNA